jgi:hypothetical protein
MQHVTMRDLLFFVPFAIGVVVVITFVGIKFINYIESTEQSMQEKDEL